MNTAEMKKAKFIVIICDMSYGAKEFDTIEEAEKYAADEASDVYGTPYHVMQTVSVFTADPPRVRKTVPKA